METKEDFYFCAIDSKGDEIDGTEHDFDSVEQLMELMNEYHAAHIIDRNNDKDIFIRLA